MKKKILLLASLVAIGAINVDKAQAADVNTWAGLATTENILVTGDIQASGTPKVINISSAAQQVIDGGYHSLTGASGFRVQILNTNTDSGITIKNFGKVVDGTAGSHTYSYTDTSGNTVYKTIESSINSFDGGAFRFSAYPRKVTVTDTVYSANTGKALDIWLKETTDTASITNTVFYGNTNTANSSAILTLTKGTFEINNLIFDSNHADQGIEFFSGTTTNINNSIFQNNVQDDYYSGDFGTLQLSGGIVNINNSQFINNYTKNYDGGAISTTNALQSITNSIFKDNRAGNTGGAIWYADSPDIHYMSNVTFDHNQAPYGGALYLQVASDLYVVDTDFINNIAQEGAAIYSERTNLNIFAYSKDVIFSGNTANNTTATYNGGSAVYYDVRNWTTVAFNINAASGKKVIFDNSIAAYGNGVDVNMNINKSGLSYTDKNGNSISIANAGEIQFNDKVGDEENNIFNINLYGGMLSIGQNAVLNATTANPDGYINNNNFYVKGDSILNTANSIIGEFAPKSFTIENGATLDYNFDVDLANSISDTLAVTANNGTLRLALFNVISDSDTEGLKIKYSNTNVNGTVKDGYKITTSTNTYNVTAENDASGSYVIFSKSDPAGGLAAAIKSESDQYVITNGMDENVTAWSGADGNVIKVDMDINGNGNSIYTENGLDGLVISSGKNVTLRNIKEFCGFNNALTNNGGTLSIIDTDIANNTGLADITNNSGNIIINAETRDVIIGSIDTDNALVSNGGTISVKGSNKVTFNGNVQGASDALMNISADTTFKGGISNMNIDQIKGVVSVKDFIGADYTLNNGTLNLDKSGSFSPNTMVLNDGTINIANETSYLAQTNIFNGGNINIANNQIGNLNLNSLTLNNSVNLALDVDLQNQIMDTISASSFSGNGMIKINQFNLLSEAEKSKVSINFANATIKDYIATDITSIEGKIFKYNVDYDKETGMFNFAGGGGNSDGYSPSVMSAPVAAQMQGYFTQLNSYDEAFRNMDAYMLMPIKTRQAIKNRNKIAINSSDYIYDADKAMNERNTGWARVHTTFENVPLKNGPKVHNVGYSTYFGAESEMYDLGKGWDGMWGVYAGYNGSHQTYNGISIYQNGGTLGLLGMAYKGNFFQGLTFNVGGSGGEGHTSFGKEDFSMLMAGIASKTGYNFEFKEGKYIIQPSLLLSYSFANTFDYTNSAGVRISSDPLHAIQIEPNIKFIANLKNGLQPYASVSVVWNILDESHYRANDVSLPQLSIKPYIKYGVGIRKSWGECFTGFFQTFITNGGRNGVGLQLGFKWALGKNKTRQIFTKSSPANDKKIVKSLKHIG